MIPAGILAYYRPISGLVSSPVLGDHWYIPELDAFMLIALMVFVCKMFPFERRVKCAVNVLCSVCVAHWLLMNLQPLLQQAITPHRFFVLFTILLIFPIGFFLVYCFVIGRFSRFVVYTVVLAPAIIFTVGVICDVAAAINRATYRSEVLSFFIEAQKIVNPRATIAIISTANAFSPRVSEGFHFRNFPEIFRLYTDTYLLHDEWLIQDTVSYEDQLQRELYMGWIFSGKLQYLWPCVGLKAQLPGDLFDGHYTHYLIKREMLSPICAQLLQTYTSCKAVSDYKLEYILVERNLSDRSGQHIATFAERILTSASGAYTLYKVDHSALRSVACASSSDGS
jgi:hypothetical protein